MAVGPFGVRERGANFLPTVMGQLPEALEEAGFRHLGGQGSQGAKPRGAHKGSVVKGAITKSSASIMSVRLQPTT